MSEKLQMCIAISGKPIKCDQKPRQTRIVYIHGSYFGHCPTSQIKLSQHFRGWICPEMTKISSFWWDHLSSVPPFPGPPKTKTGQASKKLIFNLEKSTLSKISVMTMTKYQYQKPLNLEQDCIVSTMTELWLGNWRT